MTDEAVFTALFHDNGNAKMGLGENGGDRNKLMNSAGERQWEVGVDINLRLQETQLCSPSPSLLISCHIKMQYLTNKVGSGVVILNLWCLSQSRGRLSERSHLWSLFHKYQVMGIKPFE